MLEHRLVMRSFFVMLPFLLFLLVFPPPLPWPDSCETRRVTCNLWYVLSGEILLSTSSPDFMLHVPYPGHEVLCLLCHPYHLDHHDHLFLDFLLGRLSKIVGSVVDP